MEPSGQSLSMGQEVMLPGFPQAHAHAMLPGFPEARGTASAATGQVNIHCCRRSSNQPSLRTMDA